MSSWHRNSWLVFAIAMAGCSFDPGGTGEARTSRSRGDSVRVESDAGERADAAGDGLRSGERARADAGSSDGAPGARGSAGRAGEIEGTPAAGMSGGTRPASSPAMTAAANGGGAGAIADAGVPRRDEDGGDDSDSGTAPQPTRPAAGTGGGAAGMSGSPAAGASGMPAGGTGGMMVISDRDLLLSLLDTVISVLQVDPTLPAGELLVILASASSADPALLGVVLDFVDAALACDAEVPACERTCELVQTRCEACVADTGCRASLVRSCGAGAEECPR